MSNRQITALVLAVACLLCACVVLSPVPRSALAPAILPFVLLVPGWCVTRRARIREPLIELALAFPLSAALCVAVAQISIYIGWWHPRPAVAALLFLCAASLLAELWPRRARA